MKVLISFISKSDPWTAEGPALTVTSAKALSPKYIYLFYTDDTEEYYTATMDYLKSKLPDSEIVGCKLDLPDSREYHKLKDIVPGKLLEINRKHRGVHFYLASGQTQMRFILALCINSLVINGVLIEADRPAPDDPWPQTAEGYEKRLRKLNLSFFGYFDQLRKKLCQDSVRLEIDLKENTDDSEMEYTIKLDGRFLPLRSKWNNEVAAPFKLLVVLAAKRLYGGDGVSLTNKEVKEHCFRKHASLTDISRRINDINNKALAASSVSSPIDKLVLADKIGAYRLYSLTDKLSPAEEKITIGGKLRDFLKEKAKFNDTLLKKHFPLLPPK